MSSILNATTTNGLVTSADNSGSLQLQTNNGTTALTIDTAQGVKIANAIGVGNTNPTTSGAGITFPATQSASTDANTLDDYEEGTWTPTATGETTAGTTTYTVQAGSYTKIGRQVTVSARIDYSAMTGTGAILFKGLPFASANDGMEYTGAVITSGLNWTAGSAIGIYMAPNASQCLIFNIGDDIGWGAQQCVNESVGIRFTLTYFTS